MTDGLRLWGDGGGGARTGRGGRSPEQSIVQSAAGRHNLENTHRCVSGCACPAVAMLCATATELCVSVRVRRLLCYFVSLQQHPSCVSVCESVALCVVRHCVSLYSCVSVGECVELCVSLRVSSSSNVVCLCATAAGLCVSLSACKVLHQCVSVASCVRVCVIVWRRLQTRLLLPRCRNVAADRRRADAAQTHTHTHRAASAASNISAACCNFFFFPFSFEEITTRGRGHGGLCS